MSCVHSVAQSCLTLCGFVDCSLLGSSVLGILQARLPGWVTVPYSRDLPDSGIEPTSPALAGGFFTTEPLGKPSTSTSSSSKFKNISFITTNPYATDYADEKTAIVVLFSLSET